MGKKPIADWKDVNGNSLENQKAVELTSVSKKKIDICRKNAIMIAIITILQIAIFLKIFNLI